MNGGEISGNTAESGGGVAVTFNSTFTMSGGEISGNTTSQYGGGGVYISYDSTFTMSGGEISGNTAYQGGGGVYIYNGTFTMSGGEISGNTARAAGGRGSGGGVHLGSGTFTMSGGEISGNTGIIYNMSYGGGGVYCDDTFKKQPDPGSSTSGIIYGYSSSDTAKSNKVVDSTGNVVADKGHAVRGANLKRETTAGLTQIMDSTVSGSAGGWE
jgi:hypothetical protein